MNNILILDINIKMEKLITYFNYNIINISDDEILLDNASFNDNVEIEEIYSVENDYFLDKFHDITFESIKITKDIIELQLSEKLVHDLIDWYCPTGDVYPFVYKIDDGKLKLTKVIYTPDTHLFLSFLKFPYYTVKKLILTNVFVFKIIFVMKNIIVKI